MERVKWFRQEAQDLRDIAEQCRDQPEFRRQIIALAEKCEQMAEEFEGLADPRLDQDVRS